VSQRLRIITPQKILLKLFAIPLLTATIEGSVKILRNKGAIARSVAAAIVHGIKEV
jgi:hypothetical protein